jgi:hypothetical protein
MEMRNENQIILSGDIPEGFVFTHEEYGGKKMYTGYMNVFRKSSMYDTLPVVVSEEMISPERELIASVYGELRSRKIVDQYGNKSLGNYVRAKDIQYLERLEEHDLNEVYLTGYLSKKPTIMLIGTEKDRLLARVLLAVNRANKGGYTRSDAISCLLWNENAEIVRELEKGSKIKVSGRYQSRELWSSKKQEWVTALEVSVKKLEVL